MSFGPEYHLAGGYFETGNNPSKALSAGIFRPPVSPADSNHNLGKSTGSLFSDISMSNGTSPLQTPEQANAKRKRLGLGVRGGTQNDYYNMQVDGMNEVKAEAGMVDAGQTRYNLAGQLNATPTGGAVTANGRLEESMYSDLDYRRAAGSKRAHDDPNGPSSQMEGQVDPSAQHQNAANSSGKWGFFGLQTIGQVMGKVWEFCKGGPFRGFQAGGGTGYEVNGSTVTPSVQATAVGQPWTREQQELPVHFTMEADQDTSMPPQETLMAPVITPISPVPPTVQEFTVPAQEFSSPLPYPTSDYMPYAPEYHETNNHDSLTRPAVKRRQVSENQDDLNRNWVMVDENGNGGSPSPSPALPSFGAAQSGRATPGLRPPSSLRARTPGLTSSNASRRITAPSQRFTGGPSMLPRTRAPSRLSQHTVAPTQELPSFGAPRSPPVRDTPTPSFSTPTTTAAPVSRIPLPASAGGGPGSGGPRPNFGSINAAASNGRQSPAAFNGRQSPSYANPPAPFAFSSPAYQSSVPRPSSRASVGGGGNGSGSTRRSLQAPIQLNSSSSSGVPRPSSSSAAKVLKSPTNHHHPHQHRRGESSGSVASSSARPGSSSMRRSRGLSLHGAYVQDGLKAMSNSPRLDGEAKHLAKKKAAERDADANIDAFNEKLLQMIRQGKEALGTKVEVLDDRGGIGAGNSGVWEDDEL